jgi:hypothetical protein
MALGAVDSRCGARFEVLIHWVAHPVSSVDFSRSSFAVNLADILALACHSLVHPQVFFFVFSIKDITTHL